jgi:hypothetical protein
MHVFMVYIHREKGGRTFFLVCETKGYLRNMFQMVQQRGEKGANERVALRTRKAFSNTCTRPVYILNSVFPIRRENNRLKAT